MYVSYFTAGTVRSDWAVFKDLHKLKTYLRVLDQRTYIVDEIETAVLGCVLEKDYVLISHGGTLPTSPNYVHVNKLIIGSKITELSCGLTRNVVIEALSRLTTIQPVTHHVSVHHTIACSKDVLDAMRDKLICSEEDAEGQAAGRPADGIDDGTLRTLNSAPLATCCARCGTGLKEPYPGLKHCPVCEP